MMNVKPKRDEAHHRRRDNDGRGKNDTGEDKLAEGLHDWGQVLALSGLTEQYLYTIPAVDYFPSSFPEASKSHEVVGGFESFESSSSYPKWFTALLQLDSKR